MEKLQRSCKSIPGIILLALVAWCASGAAISSASSSGDDSITSAVRIAIFQQHILRDSFLNVETRGGVVTLSGNAQRPFDVQVTKELAERTPGVVKVHSELVTVRDHTAHGH